MRKRIPQKSGSGILSLRKWPDGEKKRGGPCVWKQNAVATVGVIVFARIDQLSGWKGFGNGVGALIKLDVGLETHDDHEVERQKAKAGRAK